MRVSLVTKIMVKFMYKVIHNYSFFIIDKINNLEFINRYRTTIIYNLMHELVVLA